MGDVIQFSLVIIAIVSFSILLALLFNRNDQNRNREKAEKNKFVQEWSEIFEIKGRQFAASGLPEVATSMDIKTNNKVYAHLDGVDWMEYRKVQTGRTSAHGLTGRIRIAKGINYRFGTGHISRESINQITPLDAGELYVTNTGFLFRGEMGNKTIPFDKIININPTYLGVIIERSTGKDIYLKYDFKPYPELVALIVIAWNKNYFSRFD